MSKYWSKFVHKLDPYTPGEQPKNKKVLKLNTNENPYGPSPKVLEAIKLATNDKLRLYPDPESAELRESIAEYYGLDATNIFVGNGSDEVLAFIFYGLLKKTEPILFPDITYSFYPAYAKLYDIKFEKIPLDGNFQINLDGYSIPNGGIIFPNPNAPTGIPKPVSDIEALLKRNHSEVVVVDEAYVDFGTESAVKLVEKYENLVVTHSLSKSRSLAGMRIGCAFASKNIIEGLNRVKNSFNSYPLDRLAQIAGVEAFKDNDYFELTTNNTIKAREFLVSELNALGFDSLPSGANFIFTKHKTKNASSICKDLRDQGIIVRHFSAPSKISNYLRITIGTKDQMEILLKSIKLMF